MNRNLISPPRQLQKYMDERSRACSPLVLKHQRAILTKFHHFLAENGYDVKIISRRQLTEYAHMIAQRSMAPDTRRANLQIVSAYITWLHSKGHSQLDPLGVTGGSYKRRAAAIDV